MTDIPAESPLTLAEKVALVGGADVWRTNAVPRAGIPAIKLTDGPSGARGGEGYVGTPTACFPCGTALAASWDVDLVARVGAALGREACRKGAHVLLAPTVNIHRSALAGRNFECFSEDPFLSARMAVAYVTGVQSEGIGATVKHLVCNDSEFQRHTISSEVSERALREIYLPPFAAAVREAGAWLVMAAYNKLGGTYCAEHTWLLSDLLKGEWGFDGVVVSDWYGTQSTVAAADAGLDLEMPGPPAHFGAKLLAAVRAGDVAEATLDDKVGRLRTLLARTAAPRPRIEQSIDDPAHRALAREAACAGVVLLKNEGGLLPLTGSATRLAMIGPLAERASVQGGGSAGVTPHRVVGPLAGLRSSWPGVVAHARGCTIHKAAPVLDEQSLTGAEVEFFAGAELAGPVLRREPAARLQFLWLGQVAPEVPLGEFSARCRATLTAAADGPHRLTLTSAGRSRLLLDGGLLVDNWTSQERGTSFFGMGSTEVGTEVELAAGEPHEVVVEFASPGAGGGLTVGCLPPIPDDLMEQAVALAARSDVVVLVVGLTPEWETEGTDRVDFYLPGRQDELITRVAAANPRTVVLVNAGAPVAMGWADDVPAIAQIWYPGQEVGSAAADVLLGHAEPGGRLPTSYPMRLSDTPSFLDYPGEGGEVRYGEGIFVGYRYYDRRGVVPRFCFGHGLSYTAFGYSSLRVEPAGDGALVSVDVTNTGGRAGSEVVQVYVGDTESSVSRPERELKAFAKVTLEPGETRTVQLALDRLAFAFWHAGRHEWVVEPGEFEVAVGASSRDLRCRASYGIDG